MDEMLTIDPPPALFISGTAHFVPRNTPLALTSMIWSQSSVGMSKSWCLRDMPALFTKISSLPYLAAASLTAVSWSMLLFANSWGEPMVPGILKSQLRLFSAR